MQDTHVLTMTKGQKLLRSKMGGCPHQHDPWFQKEKEPRPSTIFLKSYG